MSANFELNPSEFGSFRPVRQLTLYRTAGLHFWTLTKGGRPITCVLRDDGALGVVLGGLDLGLVPADKKKRPCGWHLFVVPLKGRVLFGGNHPRTNKAARKGTERVARQHPGAKLNPGGVAGSQSVAQ